jgi:single-stranded-DNA-specific exonuclease
LPSANLKEFQRRFHEFAAGRLGPDDLRPLYTADAAASFTDLTERCVSQILSLGPFGFGNTAPILYCPAAVVAGPPRDLKDGKHFNVPLRQNGRLLFCKAWNFADRAHLFEPGASLDVLVQIEDDPSSRKRGYGSWCLSLKDIRPAAPPGNVLT